MTEDDIRCSLHGGCDTCGAPCDENGCTTDRQHVTSKED